MKKALLVDKDHPALRQVARSVPVSDFGSKSLESVLERMKAALHAEEDGVAIAAPQIGESLRIFIVNARALDATHERGEATSSVDDIIFINPEFTKLSKSKKGVEEGCLSLRWLYGRVMRSEKATVRAYNEKGKVFEKGASGLMAQIFQHEMDHLDGILFIDKAKDIENLPPVETDAKQL